MILRKSSFSLIALSMAFAVAFGGSAAFTNPANSASVSGAIAQNELPTNWNVFETPEGAPGRRIGGGTRGTCPKSASGMIALVPENNLGLTLSNTPTFLFYVPKIDDANLGQIEMEFILVDESDPENAQEIYHHRAPLPKGGGTIALTLPDDENLPPLQVNQFYSWYFSLICNPKASDPSILAIGGWIERIEPSPTLTQELEPLPSRDRIAVYERELLWFDAIGTLAQLLQENPNDSLLRQKWNALLESVNLSEVAQAPFLTLEPEQTSTRDRR
ncbi:DUF928 domain-containing protein [Laspinema olomoucense]|uniref:DUF928 domain-containing protein n=1 Tax=Laspinema olomoucense TaxID=3231600 RepID=UPI0021BB4DE2|nr:MULTISPECIES: DUF928 domain-containing protein [unclassified Laspinema]MCT7974361.1 DUF928 domain-containing protein [Laspinema sp. D3d]MCT7990740.1 DUF928 domain-containing protein [Laspinema sp. D3a]MCT7994403.1 DUF928 domain-containing protein [Laspinema sp. D3c]